MADYRDLLEPDVEGVLPTGGIDSPDKILAIEVGLSQAISLKRIADSLAVLSPEVLRELIDASRMWSYPGFLKPNDEPPAHPPFTVPATAYGRPKPARDVVREAAEAAGIDFDAISADGPGDENPEGRV